MKLQKFHSVGASSLRIKYFRRSTAGNLILEGVEFTHNGVTLSYEPNGSGLNIGRNQKKFLKRIENSILFHAEIIQRAIDIGGAANVHLCLPHGLCGCAKCYEEETMTQRLNG
jgi:hypothetical protein